MSWNLGASCEEEGEEENFATPFPIPEHTFTVRYTASWNEYRYVKSLLVRSITSFYKETLINLLTIVRVSEPEPPGTGGIMLEPAHIFTYWSACYVLKICNEILMFLVF